MSQQEPKGPYIYQPYGVHDMPRWASGRIYGIGGMPIVTQITGLTKEEANAVLVALTGISRKPEPTDAQ